ncbi:hypothetical protein [Alistipes sp.]|uniref:plasmid mobilization protein n=1 Tax=Alistipes sp. TaxID=1872444 RepID=UPI003AB365B6
MPTKRTQQPKTPSYTYSSYLSEEQNIRFNRVLCKVGMEYNRSLFIVKCIFSEHFEVLRGVPRRCSLSPV